jgi:hypothetical protein
VCGVSSQPRPKAIQSIQPTPYDRLVWQTTPMERLRHGRTGCLNKNSTSMIGQCSILGKDCVA